MKIPIGLRLFVSVLLAIVVVGATAVALMRQNVVDSFGDYALQIELDRLEQLSSDLGSRYAKEGNWHFIDGQRASWIVQELAQLQQNTVAPVAPVAPAAPAAPMTAIPADPLPAAPAAPMAGAAPAIPPAAPAVPPVAPAPPIPPLPPPVVAPIAPPPPPPDAPVDSLALPDRVTLLDAGGNYLAGYRLQQQANARRPVLVHGAVVGYLAVVRAATPSDAMAGAFYRSVRSSLWIIAAAGIALSALAAMLLAAHFRQPIHRLADGARKLADGRFETRLPDTRSDELGELARSFNQLAQKLAHAEQSRRQWVADTSHELRTPLSVLRAQLEAIEDGVRAPDADSIASMLRQVLALNKLIDELYALARADVGAPGYQQQRLDLWQLALQEAHAFAGKFDAARITVDCGPAPAQAGVLADPDRMRQVLGNLFENCIRYCPAGARMHLHGHAAQGKLTVFVDDSGPGVPPDALARLAERFYRVEASRDRASGGAGLGLSLCQRIVEAHQGELAFAAAPGGGLRVAITLPLAQP